MSISANIPEFLDGSQAIDSATTSAQAAAANLASENFRATGVMYSGTFGASQEQIFHLWK